MHASDTFWSLATGTERASLVQGTYMCQQQQCFLTCQERESENKGREVHSSSIWLGVSMPTALISGGTGAEINSCLPDANEVGSGVLRQAEGRGACRLWRRPGKRLVLCLLTRCTAVHGSSQEPISLEVVSLGRLSLSPSLRPLLAVAS